MASDPTTTPAAAADLPEALRLADWLQSCAESIEHVNAAAELRRLHALTAAAPADPLAWIDMTQWPPIRFPEGRTRMDYRSLDGAALYARPTADQPDEPPPQPADAGFFLSA
ncbi:hypothetical protein AVME950_02540 [Acidovorax sp. SUPP950]|uniref:hypothetical protein n=1 Tax=Acidovorax sp. SUPP950 TaxID=511901 RepID=UPI0023BC0E9E|nr:hypothetical protein [Acidovorax sp. SUPP950]GKS73726.1 hypothetical protein AVME950_02540 [Acidovorax sp. SUPP950]